MVNVLIYLFYRVSRELRNFEGIKFQRPNMRREASVIKKSTTQQKKAAQGENQIISTVWTVVVASGWYPKPPYLSFRPIDPEKQ